MSQLFVASQSGKSVNSIAMPIYINWHGNIRIMKLTVQDQKFNFWSCQYFCFGIKLVLSVPFGDKYLATNAGCFLNKRVRFERYWLLNLQFLILGSCFYTKFNTSIWAFIIFFIVTGRCLFCILFLI